MTRQSFTSILIILTCAVSLSLCQPIKVHRHEKLSSLSKRMGSAEELIKGPILPFRNPQRLFLISPEESEDILKANHAREWHDLGLNENTMLSLAEKLGIRGNRVSDVSFEGWRRPVTHEWAHDYREGTDLNQIDYGLKWYRDHFNPADMKKTSREALLRNNRIIRSFYWEREARLSNENHPGWVIKHLVDEWDKSAVVALYDLTHDTLIRFGKALGITDEGVKPITRDTYDLLKQVEIPEITDPGKLEDARSQILWWFTRANFASLSTTDSKILDFNLSYANRRPWWNEAQMEPWQEKRMPYHVMAPIGSLLKLYEADHVKPMDITTVRKEILVILEDFAEHENIGKRLNDDPSSALLGSIADHLSESTTIPRSESAKFAGFTSEFHLKYTNIRLNPPEVEEITAAINEGQLKTLRGKLGDVVRMRMLIRGINPDIGMKYALSLKEVRSKSLVTLATGGEDERDMMEYLIPGALNYWGQIDWVVVQPTLEHHFARFLGEPVIKSTVRKAKAAFWMNLKASNMRASIKNLWKNMKKSLEWMGLLSKKQKPSTPAVPVTPTLATRNDIQFPPAI